MNCRVPPPLTEDDLSAVLDGTASPHVLAHLQQCDDCAARLETARSVEAALHQQLLKWDAPTPDELADYVMGFVEEAQRATIETYLQYSPSARAEVTALQSFVQQDAPVANAKPAAAERKPRARIIPRLDEIIAVLLPPTLQPALRGGVTRGEMTAEGRGITIFIEYIVEGDGCVVTGQVMSDQPDVWVNALTQLFTEDALIQTVHLDETGEFKLISIPFGTYNLRISSEQRRTIIVHDLKLEK